MSDFPLGVLKKCSHLLDQFEIQDGCSGFKLHPDFAEVFLYGTLISIFNQKNTLSNFILYFKLPMFSSY